MPSRLVASLILSLILVPSIQAADLPPQWQAAWDSPVAADRPLQIVHEVDLAGKLPEGMNQLLPDGKPNGIARKGLEYYRQRGLGGLVCNVSFRDYLESDENWARLATAVEACRDLGMVVWIYDELGYPSGGAGGLVLKRNPDFEAQELAYDASLADPFILRPAYEHTHASNNYHAARRYANLIDDRAAACFVDITHNAYYQHLKPFFGNTIQAMFTDEPSLIAVNIGQIPEEVRKRVKVVDPIDPNVKLLPRVPWCYDLAQRYQERFGEDLIPQRRSLFVGDAEEDRRVRRQFWSLVADLIADRYFGTLESWCEQHHVASSGHSLWEEQVLHHVPLEGNGLKCLGRMHIPGLDLLTSDPQAVIHSGWMTAGMPASAARLGGRRRVMTEVSDFSQKMGGQGPAGLPEMLATAAWQATWDVTEFTLYYSPNDRSVDEYRRYGDFVGRLNAVLKPATPDPDVLLYYPIYDLWAEYLPVAEPLKVASQTPRAQQLANSFMQLGQKLQRSQIPFTLVDHENLAAAQLQEDGALKIANNRYRALLLPTDAQLPPQAAAVVEQFVHKGGRVVRAGVDQAAESAEALKAELDPPVRIEPASPHIALGRFVRDGRQVLLLVNVGTELYEGGLRVKTAGDWLELDPEKGTTAPVSIASDGNVPLNLNARQTKILVQLQQVDKKQ
ncbi:MAG: hypothetical protein GXX96_26575 [Planctomycetaceae bacterium]|nr:hypothetical protein [Planctomycetaceae bacterium]